MNVSIIEDSKTVAHILNTSLNTYGYSSKHFTSRDVSFHKFDPARVDFIIINSNLDFIDSREYVRSVREQFPNLYMLGLHTKGKWESKVKLLNAGVDDVVTYPFPVQEVMARIQAMLRRPRTGKISEIKIDEVHIDLTKRVAKFKEQPIKLRKREFSLLEYMARNKNRPISRSELLDHVWDYRRITESNTVDVHIRSLRRVFENDKLIKTIHGFGYQLCDTSTITYEKETYEDKMEKTVAEII